jgi:predicted MFS family arabinose efflux permease
LLTFTVMRVAQGLCMAWAITLTLAYLREHYSAADSATTYAAYITGNVASNLVGRFLAAGVTDHFGLASNFYFFAVLNLLGAVLVFFTVEKTPPMKEMREKKHSPFAVWMDHLRNPALRASFAIGFCILFAFIGTFTYVNFVLVGETIGLSMMSLGLVYFVFLPSMLTTPLAGYVARRAGTRPTFVAALAVAVAGLPLLVVPNLASVLAGLMLVAVGTFFAQAAATGFVGRAAASDRGSASGIYLASYYTGGVVGAAVLGLVFDRLGWEATVLGIALALVLAAVLSAALRQPRPAKC